MTTIIETIGAGTCLIVGSMIAIVVLFWVGWLLIAVGELLFCAVEALIYKLRHPEVWVISGENFPSKVFWSSESAVDYAYTRGPHAIHVTRVE